MLCPTERLFPQPSRPEQRDRLGSREVGLGEGHLGVAGVGQAECTPEPPEEVEWKAALLRNVDGGEARTFAMQHAVDGQ